jgi:hypothetical protein
MFKRTQLDDERVLRERLASLTHGLQPPGDGRLSQMARNAAALATSSHSETSFLNRRKRGPEPRRLLRRRLIVAGAVLVVLAAGTPVVAAVVDDLRTTAERTGVHEVPPSSPSPGFQLAEVPYISVQPLMAYLGSDQPVVPSAAVTQRGGKSVVFVLPHVTNYGTSQYVTLAAQAREVAVGQTYGKAVVVNAGLTPCDKIVVDPPASLQDGNQIRSYSIQNFEGPLIDFDNLFAGRPKAALPVIDGGIAHQEGNKVSLSILYRGKAPPGAHYLVTAPDGTTQGVPFSDPFAPGFATATVPATALRPDVPVAQVKLLDGSNNVVAQGHLEWYCAK